MEQSKTIDAINLRYSELAETPCCLSCGGAINHATPQPGETCVDLGSGKGHDALRMAEDVGAEGMVYGIDISDGMIEKSRRNAEKLGVANVRFLRSDLATLPIGESTVDVLISNCTINHASDKQTVWNEVYRVLKPGGRFVVSDIYSSKPVPEQFRTDPEATAECWAGSVTREEYARQLSDAGFNDVQILEESDPYEKGKIEVSSWTIIGFKPSSCGGGCCCG